MEFLVHRLHVASGNVRLDPILTEPRTSHLPSWNPYIKQLCLPLHLPNRHLISPACPDKLQFFTVRYPSIYQETPPNCPITFLPPVNLQPSSSFHTAPGLDVVSLYCHVGCLKRKALHVCNQLLALPPSSQFGSLDHRLLCFVQELKINSLDQ